MNHAKVLSCNTNITTKTRVFLLNKDETRNILYLLQKEVRIRYIRPNKGRNEFTIPVLAHDMTQAAKSQ